MSKKNKKMNRAKAIIEAIKFVNSDLTIPRDSEDIFAILFANHLKSNGGPEVDPATLLLSLRDAYAEFSFIVQDNKTPKIEEVFSKEYIEKLLEKGWVNYNIYHQRLMIV